MTTAPDAFRIREAVAYFDASTDLEEAIDELLSSGFDRAEISLLATERAVEDQLGHRYHKVAELEDALARAVSSVAASFDMTGSAWNAQLGGQKVSQI